ncbi:MAG: hypothetical protein Q8Q29_01705 [Actinomycetota bacterium]|nr:hypothetical protein [Actinomycetota bacterium]
MNPLNPIAEGMFRGRAFADEIAQRHRAAFNDLPITKMARAHNMRSAIQALTLNDQVAGFALVDDYLWTGRVEVVHIDSGQHYLLKARNAIPFETSNQRSFFEDIETPPGANPLMLLLYEFGMSTLILAQAPVDRLRLDGHIRYRLLGEIADAGVWSTDDVPGIAPFDQGAEDDFGDLSDDVRLLGDKDGDQQ